MSNTITYLTVKVIDKDGHTKSYSREESKSFVRNWTRFLYTQIKGNSNTASITDTSNASQTLVGRYNNNNKASVTVVAAATEESKGIVIGTGTTAAAKSDYAMETLIADGGGAGEMHYDAMSISETDTSSTDTITLERTMTNLSGGTINVTECGVIAYSNDNGGVLRWYLILRDTFSAKAVANNEAIVISYDIESSI